MISLDALVIIISIIFIILIVIIFYLSEKINNFEEKLIRLERIGKFLDKYPTFMWDDVFTKKE